MSTISQPPPLPGFGLPLNHIPPGDGEDSILFPNALDPDMGREEREWRGRMPILTLREIAMLRLMNQITDKHDWEQKIFDDEITQNWKAETLQSDGDFTPEMADYCIEELKYTTELYAKMGFLRVYNGDVIKSDVAIPSELQAALKAAIMPLEDVPAHKQDWHPGSGDKVLDLVHPSLFPLVYGLSRILKNETAGLEDCTSRCGQGEIIPEPSESEAIVPYGFMSTIAVYSRKFQWLPCDVDISGDTPKIVSCINNLHPQDHTGLYNIVEKIIGRVIPLWNATLTPLRHSDFPRRVEYNNVDYGDLDDYTKRNGPVQLDGEDDYDFWDRTEEFKISRKSEFIVRPNPPPFVRPQTQVTEGHDVSEEKGKSHKRRIIDLRADYASTGLQIIVKFANIHLTPEKPEYEGGTWHVEGQMNEHICSTAIYYYDNENITPSHLVFRQPSDVMELEEDVPYEQSDWTWLEAIYGLQNDESAIQVVGSIEAREGRVVTFPNMLQHQVQPFKLADPTKPGHRKILALFLVDPNIKIISTANVPCQQRDWWGRTVTTNSSVLAKLPVELREKVVEDVEDFPISLERAKELREELMSERKAFVVGYQTQNFNSVTISLCEH